ncbi:hypothetical protein GXM_03475 [Nostoc sphaeroides CCNUC1]|uniref:FecR protein domain-containing protein n=2 Tax=Nostoc sphaeroides TaxID=446679 RepID=A0A5P8VZW0_9NOSO|nr:hypothetical protein GXM_03475 [Nostoc sphaeroides CCNUC1]
MTPGDGLSTGRASLADLRFNDGSLARVGEQAIFQFLPKTRSFRLSNGTALLLIPPGRGQTRIQTPSAGAAIRGSALFVRYDKQTDTTIVGALTNSGIEVSNKEASQTQMLQAGQMMVIVKGEFKGLYDFDLRNFYETSDMVRGLDLTRQNLTPTADPAIASVQAETAAALRAQSPITGEGIVENPSFADLTTSPSTSRANNIITGNSPVDPIADDSPLNSFEGIRQDLLNTGQPSGINSNKNNVNTQNPNVVPKPTTPVVPKPTTPVVPKPTTPVVPKPTTPVEPTPITPVEPTPITPVEPTPITPVEPTPITPVEPTPITPVEPTPITPVEPTPITPVEPTPITPVEPTPITPVEPTPITPVEPTPITPVEPTPITPVEPTPITPVEPTPITPVEPTPITPVEPTPIIPTT